MAEIQAAATEVRTAAPTVAGSGVTGAEAAMVEATGAEAGSDSPVGWRAAFRLTELM
jgi:hypothetical protein